MALLMVEIEESLNRASRENRSGTPDFILAEYLMACLHAFEAATNRRDEWHSVDLSGFKSDATRTLTTATGGLTRNDVSA
jgi:hypothetical protein